MNIETMTEEQAEAQHEAYQRERRERIATAILAGMWSNPNYQTGFATLAGSSVIAADALIAELDKQP